MKKNVNIGTASVDQGQKGKGLIPAGELAGRLAVTTPVLVINGAKEGPTLWINAAIQGDEVTGIEVARQVFETVEPRNLLGSIVLTPLSNITAFCSRSQNSPIDGLDLAYHCFPGNPNGKFSERTAYTLFNLIKTNADYLIDLHCTTTDSIPYTNFSVSSTFKPEISQAIKEMAKAFGAGTICQISSQTATRGFEGSLDVVCCQEGIPAIMGELGGRRLVSRHHASIGVRGIFNLMKSLEMMQGKPEIPEKQLLVTDRSAIYANRGGILYTEIEPGKMTSKNTIIARIQNEFFEDIEIVRAPENCFALGVDLYPAVNMGDRICILATKWKELT